LHRLDKGFQELEEKRAEAKIAHLIVQILLMEFYDLHIESSHRSLIVPPTKSYIAYLPLTDLDQLDEFPVYHENADFLSLADVPQDFMDLVCW
jgi:hypothetical protein